jgi:hypothetical protein
MGYVLIVGRPSGVRRQAFCRLIKEPVAVPSRSRSEGALEFGQKALRLLLALAEGRGIPAAMPSRWQRETPPPIVSPVGRPASRAASLSLRPAAMARRVPGADHGGGGGASGVTQASEFVPFLLPSRAQRIFLPAGQIAHSYSAYGSFPGK